MGQKFFQNRSLFLQLSQVGFQPNLPGLGNILLPISVWDKGVPIVKALVAGTGVLRALPAEWDAAVLQGTLSYGTALIARTATAAGTVAAKMHGAQSAVQAT